MFGQRLRLARKKAGLSMRALSEQMSPAVTPQAISKYEAGEMMPSSAVLVGLGKALGVSLDFLMSEQVEKLAGIQFRKHSGICAKDYALVEVIVTEKLEEYLVVEDILDLEPDVDPFSNLRCEKVESFFEIEDKANKLREHWQLGNDPIPSMMGLLEDKGIKVIEADLPERFDGLACEVKLPSGKPNTEVIVISSRTNVERKRFNLAHELAHRIIKNTGHPKIKLEKAMNRFAAAFLVAADHLKVEVGEKRHGITYHEIIRLKRFYGISAAAMLMRLRDVNLLPENTVEYAFQSYARSWRTDEPEPIKEEEGFGAFEKPRRFDGLVYRALAEELISPVRASQLLKQPLSIIEQQIRGPQNQ